MLFVSSLHLWGQVPAELGEGGGPLVRGPRTHGRASPLAARGLADEPFPQSPNVPRAAPVHRVGDRC